MRLFIQQGERNFSERALGSERFLFAQIQTLATIINTYLRSFGGSEECENEKVQKKT